MGLYNEMVRKGVEPDVVTYTALIDGYFKDGNMKSALKLYKEMIEARLKPNVVTLSCLIMACARMVGLVMQSEFSWRTPVVALLEVRCYR